MGATRTTIDVGECTDIEVRAYGTNTRYPFVDVVLDGAMLKIERPEDIDRLEAALDEARAFFPTRHVGVAR